MRAPGSERACLAMKGHRQAMQHGSASWAGLGPLMSPPLTGSLRILRTRGRKTGLLRETPLGYAILDGSVWCCAGFGAQTHWYRNILADAGVEGVLANGSAFAGTAEVGS